MVSWLKRLVVGHGNVIRERAYTNWNTLDVDAIVAEKRRERADIEVLPDGSIVVKVDAKLASEPNADASRTNRGN